MWHLGVLAGRIFHASGSPLTKYQFEVVNWRVLAGLGTHSFRIEPTLFAAHWGMSPEGIQQVEMRVSSPFKSYILPYGHFQRHPVERI